MNKYGLLFVALSAAVSALANCSVATLEPYTTEELVSKNAGSVNYISGDGASRGGMTQAGDLVTLSGNNQWSAKNVTLDLGSVDRIFSIPELHLISGSSISVASGTLKTGSKFWLESGGGTLTVSGANSRLQLGANLSFGTGDLSDFSLLNGASLTGTYGFTFGAGGKRDQLARIYDSTVDIKSLTVGKSSSGNTLAITNSDIRLTDSFSMGTTSYSNKDNLVVVSNSTVVANAVNVGYATGRNHMEIADGSVVTAKYAVVGYKGDVLTNCLENVLLVTGTGTMLDLAYHDANTPALRIGYFHSATNRLTISNGASVTVDGPVMIGQESDARGNTLLIDHGTLTIEPTIASQYLRVGYYGTSNSLVVDNQGQLNATSTNLTVAVGPACTLVSRNGSTVRIGKLGVSTSGMRSVVEVDNAKLSVARAMTVAGRPVFVMKGALPELQFSTLNLNGPFTNVFVLGATSVSSSGRESYAYSADSITVNGGTSITRFVVKIEQGCPDGVYNLMTWNTSNWVDVDFAKLFVIEKPEDYKAKLRYKAVDNPGAGYGTYFKIEIKRKKGLVLMVR